MSSWGKADNAGASPLWALMQLNTEQSSGNQTTLFEDTTADAYVTGQTIGLYNYADGEVPAGAAHAGWNLKVEGSGGRSGRTQYQTLVALTDAA
jgi:hypothetical protein